jgi:beta-galactosidase
MAFHYGVDYYPEHWPEERWPLDARMQREAGFNTVRLAEFAWSRMQPSQSQFDFAWLDRAIDVLAAEGMQVVLGTPTAAPPAWLIEQDSTILPVDEGGRRVSFGGRRHYCPTHSGFRLATERIVTAMAERYAEHAAVIGWQIDNEYGGNNTARCYCDCCRAAFHAWLQRHYGSLERLNDTWGTVFWSQEYTTWEQIPLPLPTSGIHSPSLLLAHRRFASDAFVAYQQVQLDLLRALAPRHWVTTNLMRAFTPLDYAAIAQPLDFVAWDNYPRSRRVPGLHPDQVAFTHDLMRGLRHQNFWVMEEQSGACGWEIMKTTPRPGEIRLWAYQAVGRGADGIIFFRWRTARFGAEEYWHGILDHDGKPNRRYQEVKRTGAELKLLGPLLDGSQVQASVALLRAYDVLWALEIQPHHPDLVYDEIQQAWFNGFYTRGVQTDIVSPRDDISGYGIVVAPALFLADEVLAERLETFVQHGGTLILTFRSGVKDPENVVTERTLPGVFSRLCGVEVAEYDCAEVGDVRRVELRLPSRDPLKCSATWWVDALRPTGAAVLGTHASEYLAGQPAVTENAFGAGHAMYVATHLDASGIAAIVDYVAARAELDMLATQSIPGVEISSRRSADREFVFLLNHADEPATITLDDPGTDAVGGTPVSGEITLLPRDVRVVVRSLR